MYALVDCNNFFVSCERIFRPELEGKPVVVLSSGDGCVVSRSNEAKALGVPMGAPAFQYRQLFRRQGITQFSANFDLYGDISQRIVAILTAICPRIEVYSVDESFLDIHELPIGDYAAWGRDVRTRILQAVGVPVSVGIAPTKTLAKLGAGYAKKHPVTGGVVDLVGISEQRRGTYLAAVAVEDVWGVGRRLAPRLKAEGVHTAQALCRLRLPYARQLMGLGGWQLVAELQGTACHNFAPLKELHQTIMRSRTFGEDTSDLPVVEAAVSSMAARAALELRREQQAARKAQLFISTNRHKPGYQAWHEEITFAVPAFDTGAIITALLKRLREIYSPRQAYHRAGVTLYDFSPADQLQTDLLGTASSAAYDRSRARMAALDAINDRFGAHRIRYASETLSATWQPKHALRSPAYVTDWQQLPEAYPAYMAPPGRIEPCPPATIC